MLIVVKGNTEYKIDDHQKQSFIERGYDVISKDGKVLEKGARQYSKSEFELIVKENEELKAEIKSLKKTKDK